MQPCQSLHPFTFLPHASSPSTQCCSLPCEKETLLGTKGDWWAEVTKWLLGFLPSWSRVLQEEEGQRSLCFLCLPPSRLHADGPIQPDDLSIEEWVLDDGLYQMSILSRVTQSAGEGHLAGQEVAHFIWEGGQQRSAK